MTSENTAPVSERGEWTAWLIERDGQWYAAAPHSRWTTQQAIDANTWRENWTSDANKALRFARKRDAETLIRYEGWQNAVATEHIWLAREEWPDLRDPRNIRAALRQAQDNVALSASQSTDSADRMHEQNTPSTPPDTPEGVSEAEAAMKEIFAKHGPALREALRPFQTLPAIGDEVVEAIRQMILVEEAEQTRLRSMPSAYSWNKVAVVDGKLDVLRKLSALHQAGKLPAETDMALLRRLVDLTYGFAMEDQSVPSTKVALALIEQAQDDVRDGPKDGLTMKDRLHMRGVNYTPPNSNGERG